ncbi:MAG: hypothetical protein Q7R76_06085 [Candidatus Woesearchaeota archaeon]|nr:hypothetical protein [Candidatus Woesearchaeota archaeon]
MAEPTVATEASLVERIADYKRGAWRVNDEYDRLQRELARTVVPELMGIVNRVVPDGYVCINVRIEPQRLEPQHAAIGFDARIIISSRGSGDPHVPNEVLQYIRDKADIGMTLGKYALACARFDAYDPSR